MFAPEVLEPTVRLLAGLAGDGRALEFAIGTGRVAIPLAEAGVPVSGIELSPAMADELRRKGADIPVVVGDMAVTGVADQFSLVYCVWNSIANLRTQDEQVACFQNASRHLAPGGHFAIDLWVPALRRLPPGQTAVPFHVGQHHFGFDTLDTTTQQGTSHHYSRDPDGAVTYSARDVTAVAASSLPSCRCCEAAPCSLEKCGSQALAASRARSSWSRCLDSSSAATGRSMNGCRGSPGQGSSR